MAVSIAFIGAGRVASALAPALQRGGARVAGVWSRTRLSAERLASRLGCPAAWGRVERTPLEADVYLLCVADAALPEVARRLRPGREGALLAHTAGSVELAACTCGGTARGGVFYPLQTFSHGRAADFGAVHFFLEASSDADLQLLRSLALLLAPPAHIHASTSASRRALHLAAVFACNFSNHCCAVAAALLRAQGLDFGILLPLVDETVAKLHQLPPREAQTGPAARGDADVMGLHRAMLASEPRWQRLYADLSASIAALASAPGAPAPPPGATRAAPGGNPTDDLTSQTL